MRFAFSDEQLAFRDAVRDLLEKECSPAAVREAWTNGTGRVPGLWQKLDDMGLFDTALSPLDLVLVFEETGRACVPEPLAETFAAGSGEGSVGLGLGLAPMVLYADSVDRLVLERWRVLFAVDRSRAALEQCPAVDRTRRMFAVEWSPDESERLDLDVGLVHDRAALAAAAQLSGLGQHLLDVTVAYATQREQFGQPIGAFQAVKHHLANVALGLEFARPVIHRAAATMNPTHVSMAKAFASDAAMLASRVALQVHGAIGYTVEHDLHMWMKRAWALAGAWGDSRWHRRRVGDAILGTRERRT